MTFALEMLIKVCLSPFEGSKIVLTAFVCGFAQVVETAQGENAEMEECIVEDGPPGFMEVQHLPLVDQLLIAESPPEDVLTQS